MNKKTYYIFIILLTSSLIGCDNGNPLSKCNDLIKKPKHDLPLLLPNGHHTVHLQELKNQKELNELSKTVKEAIQKNQIWYLNYMNANMKYGEALPYHKNFGLSKTNYERMTWLQKNIRYEGYSDESIQVERTANEIRINGSGPLKIYGEIIINLDSNIVYMGNQKLIDYSQVNVKDSSNALGSDWTGYSWKNEHSRSVLDEEKNIVVTNAFQYKLTIGRLNKTGQRYMGITYRLMENNKNTITADNTIIF